MISSCTGEDGNGSLWTAGRLMDDPPPTRDGPPSPIWKYGVTDPLSGDSTEVCISPWSLNRRSGGGLAKTVPLITLKQANNKERMHVKCWLLKVVLIHTH